MERLKTKYRNMTLRRSFILTVLLTFCAIAFLSGLALWGCSAFRAWLLPDSNAVWLSMKIERADGEPYSFGIRIPLGEEMTQIPSLTTEYEDQDGKRIRPDDNLVPSSMEASVIKLENSYALLSPRRKIAYQGCGVLMVAFPAVFSAGGILFCGFFFYRHKLCRPLECLSEAAGQIAERNLDFRVSYESGDELGKLCRSFEQMRQVLDENNREMWKMIEERKRIQASVAHDLRNPIAIIEGYTEYLQMNLQTGHLTAKRIAEMVGHIEHAAKRLEQYTESVREINQLEDIEIRRNEISVEKLWEDIRADFSFMASDKGIKIHFGGGVPEGLVRIDVPILYRVLENIMNNALRYAKETVDLSFAAEEHTFMISITDDGAGFPDEILYGRNRLLLPGAGEDGHSGVGLTISRLLCRKHGGRLEIGNRQPHGAEVKIVFGV